MDKDWRGTPIGVGSRVVYPTRAGSWMTMNEGTVLEIVPRDRYGKTFYDVKVQGDGKERPGYVNEHRVTVISPRKA